MNILFLIFLALNFKVDINNATLDEIKTLPIGYEDAESLYRHILKVNPDTNLTYEDILRNYKIPPDKAERIFNYIFFHGGIKSYYELSKVPGVNAGDLARWKAYIFISPRREGKDLIFNIQRIRSRTASEESPRESALDWWILKLIEPINVNRAEVDELYALDRVSLIDAAAVVRYSRILPLRNSRDLRRVPHLSYYGYRNMVNFVRFRDATPEPINGWTNFYTVYTPGIYVGESSLDQVISELSDTVSRELYLASGWTDDQVDSLRTRLTKEREYLSSLTPKPFFRIKTVGNIQGKFRFGALLEEGLTGTLRKGFAGVERVRIFRHLFLNKLYLGDLRATFGQGLLLDNSDELRDRLISHARGIFGDITSSSQFAFRGLAVEFKYLGFNPILVYSKNSRSAILDRFGHPLFYFTSDITPPTLKDRVSETVFATSLRMNLGGNTLPVGTQVALNFMKLTYDRPFSLRWCDVLKPFSRETVDDGAFKWNLRKDNTYGSLELRTVIFPFSVEMEYAHQKNGGDAFLLKSRIQENPYYFNIILRHYDVDYTNPFMRTFQEASRFEYTVLERSYRLNDPIYSGLTGFPVPKPETGFYVETRYQVSGKLLFPRVYLDVWRDNTSYLRNYRFQGSVEYRFINPFRIRFTQKIQDRRSNRYLGITRSLTYENTLRLYYVSRGTYLGITLRYSRVFLTAKEGYDSEIDGGYLSVDVRKPIGKSLDLRLGSTVWRNDGMSQWGFEDTGIDFMYGNGEKIYLSFVERVARNLGIKVKFRWKNTYFPHGGLIEQRIYNPETGESLLWFEEARKEFKISLTLDYRF